MDKLKQRFSKQSVLEDVVPSPVQDEQESILADDSDAFRQSEELTDSYRDMTLSLKLSESDNNFADDLQEVAVQEKLCSYSSEEDYGIMDVSHEAKGRTVFEIISTETIKEGGANSYVLYRVLLTRPSLVDNNPCIIEKRYSEFEKLHIDLKKSFGRKMDDIAFPKKKLIGNFTPKTIGKRSRAFEQYLTHLYSMDELRFSRIFLEFFYMQDLKIAYSHLLSESYGAAVTSFQKVLLIQERIIAYNSEEIGKTFCDLVVCYQATEKEEPALAYGYSALKCFNGKEGNVYYLPLLQTCIHLSWKLGKDKKDLEEMMMKTKRDSKELPSLLSVVQESQNS